MSAHRRYATDCLVSLSEWIDVAQGDRDAEAVTWGRVSKVAEECGEVIAAYIGATGQNPRKGRTHSVGDVQDELLDVAVTALAAIAHLYGNQPPVDLIRLLERKAADVAWRAGVMPGDRDEHAGASA